MMLITLEGERPLSWNKYWSGMHWAKRKAEADRVHWLVRSQLSPDCQPASQPVRLSFTVYFRGNQQDASNICIKPYEDALIGWIINDDSPAYVSSVTIASRKDNNRPRMEIEIS